VGAGEYFRRLKQKRAGDEPDLRSMPQGQKTGYLDVKKVKKTAGVEMKKSL